MGCRPCNNNQELMAANADAIQSLADCQPNRYSDQVATYLCDYGLDTENRVSGLEHYFGTFQSGLYTLAGHIYVPSEPRGTVFLLHGYLNHCVQLRHLIEFLAENGYAVAAFDLPGHGHSSGEPGAIEDFSEYSQALSDFADVVSRRSPGPYHVIGFSTGGSAVIDSLLVRQSDSFQRVILVSPLVRCIAWEPSRLGSKIFGSFVKSVPRAVRKESSDRQYIKFIKTDPLQVKSVPMEWVNALHAWNDRIAEAPACPAKIKVIQGNRDTTVDWKHNIEFIRRKFPNAEVVLIEPGRHELLNESPDIRTEVFDQIDDYLSNNTNN